MAQVEEPARTLSDRKHAAIIAAATRLFLEKGYEGTSMDDVAAAAVVSKPTVYKHFADKSQLYAEIVRCTVGQIDELVALVLRTLQEVDDVEDALARLGREMLGALMQPKVVQLRRLVIASADRFPEVGRSWYESGFGRVLTSLADCFRKLAERRLLRVEDPRLAANHFVGLLLWIPLNRAMFDPGAKDDRKTYAHLARGAARAFLFGYGARSRS